MQSSQQIKCESSPPLQELMGQSEVIRRLVYSVKCVAKSEFSVLILGETGSGKDLVAHAIHQGSPRFQERFVPVDCGAIPETLIESELFGHEKGAFTGASTQTCGKIEAAQGGTLFLDEISNLPLGSQTKLLRTVQEKIVYRIGSAKPVHVDVRILAASNHNLQALIDAGSFRTDLFFRLNEFSITVPPLRDRKADIVYLANRFLDITNAELNKSVKGISEPALEVLLSYRWPGNVRQLRSTIRRAVLLADEMITEEHLDIEKMESCSLSPKVRRTSWSGLPLKEIVHRHIIVIEREAIRQVLLQTRGNKAKAARLLQIDYKTMHSKAKEYGISINQEEDHVSNKKDKEPVETGVGGILRGLASLVERLGDLAETGQQISKSGEIGGLGKEIKGIYGFTVKVGLGGDKVEVEPFGNIRRDEGSGVVVQEIREPVVDVFEEEDHILVLAEMPGISAEDVQLDVKDDLLIVCAARGEKKYRKEVLLPMSVQKEKMSTSCNNGILEIRCLK